MAIQLFADNLAFSNPGFCFGGSQDFENASGFNDFSFDHHQLQQQQQQSSYPQWQSMEQRTQNMSSANNFLLQKINGNLSQSIGSTFEKQMQEIGRVITLQNEKLRLALHEERKNQLATLVRKYELKAQILLKQKDEEMAKAVNRTMELEDFLRRIEIESLSWQRLARENEAMVNSLTNTIQQIKENNSCLNENGIEDAGSCCLENRAYDQETENEQHRVMMMCKSCNSRNSCCIFLPCRHLCSCKDCEALLDSCPVCGMLKNNSIEALV